MLSSSNKSELRKQGRFTRKQLAASTRRQATAKLNSKLARLLQRSQRVALYLHFDGEPDLLPCLQRLNQQGKQLYLPLLTRRGMCFVSSKALRRARINRFGIIEPHRSAARISSKRLQAIVMPLTAYDDHGNRLGMGAGYYDRELSWQQQRKHWRGPLLIGSAWSVQAADHVPTDSWDRRLNRLCNEQQTLRF